jgi:hypothetical protein
LRARELHGEEKARWRRIAVAMRSKFADFEVEGAARELPLVAPEPTNPPR